MIKMIVDDGENEEVGDVADNFDGASTAAAGTAAAAAAADDDDDDDDEDDDDDYDATIHLALASIAMRCLMGAGRGPSPFRRV